ncbi:MAG: type III-A CRISPR-associated RAMP protein Csm3 [Candidatus Helarchaeota archaeon]
MVHLLGNVILKGKIIALTGLHIGGSRDAMEIGGVDSPVLRDPSTRYPYIPGSSLKGKMRMLIEFAEGRVKFNEKGEGKPCDCGKCMVCLIFGNAAEVSGRHSKGPTRLTIRDAYPTEKTVKMWENIDSELLYTEYKGENTIDRITSAANPRFFERVVPGSEFEFEMVYSVYDFAHTNDITNLKYVFQAMQLLEHSALGGHGSRGYGKVQFKLAEPFIFSVEDYRKGKAKIDALPDEAYKSLKEISIEQIVVQVSQKLS